MISSFLSLIIDVWNKFVPIAWAYRLLKLEVYSDPVLGRTKKPYKFEDLMIGIFLMVAYVGGAFLYLQTWLIQDWTRWLYAVGGGACGYFGDKAYGRLKRTEVETYNQD